MCGLPRVSVCVFVSLGSLYRVVCFLLPFCSLLWINFSELNALRKVASLTYLSHCFSWQFVKKIYQKEIQQIICLIKNAQGMAQFTKLSIRLSLRHCYSINLQLSSARATTLINHRVRSLTLCRSCTNGNYLFSSFSRSLSLSSSLFRLFRFGSLWFECGPWIDISIAVPQLLWLSILKLLLVFLSRLLISVDLTLSDCRYRSLSISFARPFVGRSTMWKRHLEIVTSYGCDRILFALSAAKGQSSIHLISF